METYSIPKEFQSTRPRGARLSPLALAVITIRFNPRARAGRDCGRFNSNNKTDLWIRFREPCREGAKKISPIKELISQLIENYKVQSTANPTTAP
jgi:hypothetical protein